MIHPLSTRFLSFFIDCRQPAQPVPTQTHENPQLKPQMTRIAKFVYISKES